MDTGADRITTLLTGELLFIVYTALLLTIPISWGLLKRYKRAVIRTMAKQSSQLEITQPIETTPAAPPESGLKISVLDPSNLPERPSLSTCQKILLRAPTKAALVYLLAGFGYAAIMTWGVLTSGQMAATPTRLSITMMLYGWPVVLATQFIAGTTRRRWLKPVLIYSGVYLLLSLLALALIPDAKLLDLLFLWVLINIPTTLIWWIVLNRRLRAVSPLVLTFLVLAVTGSLVLLELFFYNDFALALSVNLLIPLGLGVRGMIVVNILIGITVFCVIGWMVLRWVRWQYKRQMISEQIITLDALWLIFSITKGIELVFEGLIWALVPLVAFLIYKVLTVIGFRWLTRQHKLSDSPCLLLLRVFSLGWRSEQLFDAVSTHWRYLGKIHLIAGPDLATTTIEPHEFLDYVSGNLGNNFIDSAKKLETALTNSKVHPDHDGRYRVEEFFCYGDTWQMVLTRLQNACDVILMDLRGFTPQNAGCIFEINTLIDHLPLGQVIFTVDDTTNRDFLQTTIKSAWQKVANDSPNRLIEEPILTLFEYQSGKNLPLDHLLETLCEAASPKA